MENSGINQNVDDLVIRDTEYLLRLQVAKALLKRGLLKSSEYKEIDTILRQKYRPLLSVFISENKGRR
ncbi:MAG: SHOCT domain-containing protein [Oscillospiraceae bacterium]